MRWDYFKARGFGPFREEIELDLTKLGDARLVAVVGANGAGKTTLLELGIPGAIDRATPTRGSLADLAVRRDAFLETRLVNGSAWTIRHMVDGSTGKGESVVLKDGVPALPDTKVRSFDKWREEALPPSRVLFASTFAAQGSSGFLDASRADRVAVILRLVEAEHIEGLASAARERARETLGQLNLTATPIADERARLWKLSGGSTPDVTAVDLLQAQNEGVPADRSLRRLEASLEEACSAVQTARDELERLTAEHKAATERRAAYVAEHARVEQHNSARGELMAELTQAADRRRDLDDRIANNRAVIARKAEIEAAVVRFEQARARAAEVDVECQKHLLEARSHERTVQSERKAADTEGKRAADARRQLDDLPGCEVLAGLVETRREELQRAQLEAANCELRIQELDGKQLAGAEDRIKFLRGGLDAIAEAEELAGMTVAAQEIARSTLDEDDERVELARTVPAALKGERETLTKLRKALAPAEAALRAAEQAAAKLETLRPLKAVAEAAEAGVRECKERERATTLEAAKAQALADALITERDALSQELQALQALVAKAKPLAEAEGRLAELEPQLVTAIAEVDRLEVALSNKPALPVPEAPAAPKPFDRAGGEGFIETLTKRVATIEAQLETAHAGAARIAELEAQRAAAELELGDWNQLAADLGKDGVQAMEVDAAGPELTELTNDLLHSCFGSRFTVRIDTQRASSDGKRLLEGCDVNVIDAQEGREGEGSTFSGGERVILGEALSLALAMFGCQRSGEVEHTLIRDESGAALDPSNAAVYVAMLRRAAELVRARVLVVSHTPAVWDLCDARIHVGERGVEIAA